MLLLECTLNQYFSLNIDFLDSVPGFLAYFIPFKSQNFPLYKTDPSFCIFISYTMTAVAIPTFSESQIPCIGINSC